MSLNNNKQIQANSYNSIINIFFIIISLLIFTLFASKEWLFPNYWDCDSANYLGLALRYDDPNFSADNYKLGRLPWIYFLFIINKIFSPIVANYVVNLGSLILCGVFLYLVINRIYGELIAYFVSIFYIAYPQVHGDYGWQYHNVFAGPFYIISIFLLVESFYIKSLKKTYLIYFVFSITYSLCIITSQAFVNIGFLIPIIYFTFAYKKNKYKFFQFLGICILGFFTTLILFGLINFIYGRDFIFLKPLFGELDRHFSSETVRDFWQRDFRYLISFITNTKNGGYLILPLFSIIVSVFCYTYFILKKSIMLSKKIVQISFFIQFILAFFAYVILYIFKFSSLDYSHFTYPLNIISFFTVATFLSIIVKKKQNINSTFRFLIALSFFLFLGFKMQVYYFLSLLLPEMLLCYTLIILFYLIFISGLLFCFKNNINFSKKEIYFIFIYFLAVSFINSLSLNEKYEEQGSTYNFINRKNTKQNYFNSVINIHSVLYEYLKKTAINKLVIYYNFTDQDYSYQSNRENKISFSNLCNLSACTGGHITFYPFPTVSIGSKDRHTLKENYYDKINIPNSNIAVLYIDETKIKNFLDKAKKFGYKLELVEKKKIKTELFSFNINFYKIINN